MSVTAKYSPAGLRGRGLPSTLTWALLSCVWRHTPWGGEGVVGGGGRGVVNEGERKGEGGGDCGWVRKKGLWVVKRGGWWGGVLGMGI